MLVVKISNSQILSSNKQLPHITQRNQLVLAIIAIAIVVVVAIDDIYLCIIDRFPNGDCYLILLVITSTPVYVNYLVDKLLVATIISSNVSSYFRTPVKIQ